MIGGNSMRVRCAVAAVILKAALAGTAVAQVAPPPKVVVGDNPALSGAPLYIALEKGYYREAGLDVQLETGGTSSDMAVPLATNRLQVMSGALSAGFFNSLSKGLPIGLLMSRATSPYFHYLMIRPDRKTKFWDPADLKGRSVAVAARGAILVYELAKILESGGLSLADVDLKYIPFSQMATALTNGAVDAALMISPLQDQVEAKGLGLKWINADSRIRVQPVVISVWQANTDWVKQNEGVARTFVLATLRGVRDYCNAYHGGPNRDEVTRILTKYSDVKDAGLINQIEWGATDIHGRIFEASVMDVQDTFFKEKLVSDRLPFSKIAPAGWVSEVAARLGPYRPVSDDGAPGCR
jgi:NitT/TauT family transport system substrate-binding protein